MKRIVFVLFLLFFLFSFNAAAQNKPAAAVETTPATFKSDGCSMFPKGKYRDCCVEHERAYSSGRSWTKRWRADKKLFKCVVAKQGLQHKFIAPLMWLGVRGRHSLAANSVSLGFWAEEIFKIILKKL